MIWQWVERAAFFIMAARLGIFAIKGWRSDDLDVDEIFASLCALAVCVLIGVSSPTGSVIAAVAVMSLAVMPDRWVEKGVHKLLRIKPEKIGPSTQESDRQLKE